MLWERNEKNIKGSITEMCIRTQNYFVAMTKNKKFDNHTKVKIQLKTEKANLCTSRLFLDSLLNGFASQNIHSDARIGF